MNEVLIAFLILLISFAMFFSIIGIVKADEKINKFNNEITKFKKTDLSKIKITVKNLSKINKFIKLNKIKKIFEISMTVFSIANIFILYKKLTAKYTK